MKKTVLATILVLAFTTAVAVPVAPPFPDVIFVRGGFNGWGTTDAMTWDGVDRYEAVLTLDAGTWEFKIADDGWSNPDFGATGDPNVVLGTPSDIGTIYFNNFLLALTNPGEYLFTLFDLASDLQSGKVLVTRIASVPQPGAVMLMLIGLAGISVLRHRR
jgi:hypothetical protein